MTKQEMYAGIEMLANLYDQFEEVSMELAKRLVVMDRDKTSDDTGRLAERIKDIAKMAATESGISEKVVERIGKLSNELTDSDREVIPPSIAVSVDYGFPIVAVKYPAGDGAFVAETGQSDYGTRNIFVGYDLDTDCKAMVGDNYIDILYAEVKKGELAEVSGLDSDNNDVDVMIYENPYQEDYTRKFQLEHLDMENVLSEEE